MQSALNFVLLFSLTSLLAIDGRRITAKTYRPVTIASLDESCPLDDVVASTRSDIRGDIQGILRDSVLPALGCGLGECEDNPALSCNQIFDENPSSDSGNYWLQSCDGNTFQVYCTFDNPCGCNTTGAWTRIGFLNMSNPDEQCPHGLVLVSSPRSCERKVQNPACVSAFYASNYLSYSRVCGRIIGYQDSSPDAFHPYFADRSFTVDDPYVDGISVTYGFSPRKHIWTFAAGVHNAGSSSYFCPCSQPSQSYTGAIPPFIGDDWFCENGANIGRWQRRIYTENPLWDGEGCNDESTCCTLHNPPWFCKELPQTTRDNVEVRMCGDEHQNNENVPVQLIELYVQ